MVAEELEISERTARRDLEALCMAGLPVYSERGRGGGWRLLGGGRTDLSGLTAPEARALFLVAGPASAATPELKAALRKLVRALPESFRSSAEAAAASVVLDPHGWGRNRPAYRPRHLDVLQEATTEGEQVRLGYSDRQGTPPCAPSTRSAWRKKGRPGTSLAGTEEGLRDVPRQPGQVGRADRRTGGAPRGVRAVPLLGRGGRARRPAALSRRGRGPGHPGGRRCSCSWFFEGQLSVGDSQPGERVPVTVRGPSVDMIVRQLCGFGRHIEVLAPPEARQLLARLGQELVATYGEPGSEAKSLGRGVVSTVSKLKLDLHDIYNRGDQIDRALRDVLDEAARIKASQLEIIPGKGSGQLKKRVLRFLDQKEIRPLYHRVEKDSDNFGRIFVYFRWK